MKPETIATLAVAFVAALAGAYEVPFGGDFAEADADGFPSAWTWHDYPAYLPRADVKVEKGDGGNEIHYCNTRGENGSAIRSKKRIPGKAGDVVTVRLESRGSGKAWFIRDGVCTPVTWTRADGNSQFVYTYEDGTEISYGVGKTYVCIIGDSGSFSYE